MTTARPTRHGWVRVGGVGGVGARRGMAWLGLAWVLAVAGCGAAEGEPFGRALAGSNIVRMGVLRSGPAQPLTADPARAATRAETILADQLFAGLTRPRSAPAASTDRSDTEGAGRAGDAPASLVVPDRLDLATAIDADVDAPDRVLKVTLKGGLRFANGAPLTAHDVVASWQRTVRLRALCRAQRKSVDGSARVPPERYADDDVAPPGAADTSADPASAGCSAIGDEAITLLQGARDLLDGRLLRTSTRDVAQHAPPFVVFDERGDAPVADAAGGGHAAEVGLLGAQPVRAIDSNVRRACCGRAVQLRSDPSGSSAVRATLRPDEDALVLSARITAEHATYLELRTRGGGSGWAKATDVATWFPSAALRHVVDRTGSGLPLRATAAPDAVVRAQLADDATVEVLDRLTDAVHVMDTTSLRVGYLPAEAIDDVVLERTWFLVTPVDAHGDAERTSESVAVWAPARAFVRDMSLLGVHATDDTHLTLTLAAPAAGQTRARLADLLAALPLRVIDVGTADALGGGWASAAGLVSSGTYRLTDARADALTLTPAPGVGEGPPVPTVVLIIRDSARGLVALYRSGKLDAIADGGLDAASLPLLRRASDFVPGPLGGGMRNAALRSLSLERPWFAALTSPTPAAVTP